MPVRTWQLSARICQPLSAAMSNERRNTNLVFQIATATVDCQFPDAKLHCAMSEALLFSNSDDVA
jgi:hypothetical protein